MLNSRIYTSRKKSPKYNTSTILNKKISKIINNPVADYFSRKSPPRKVIKLNPNYSGLSTKSQKKNNTQQNTKTTYKKNLQNSNFSKKKETGNYNYQKLLQRRDYLLKKKKKIETLKKLKAEYEKKNSIRSEISNDYHLKILQEKKRALLEEKKEN